MLVPTTVVMIPKLQAPRAEFAESKLPIEVLFYASLILLVRLFSS